MVRLAFPNFDHTQRKNLKPTLYFYEFVSRSKNQVFSAFHSLDTADFRVPRH